MRALSHCWGPQASRALQEVDELVSRERSPVLNSGDEVMLRHVALVRMGKPVEDMRWFRDRDPKRDAQYRQCVLREVAALEEKL
jgi:hypothetical protein